jgi:uncharacterized repeat protein (TIGR02543 family)
VPLGEWRITAKAYKEDGLAGTGNLSLTVVPGHNPAEVPMYINGGYFDITADASVSNGTITADFGAAFPETTVTLTVTPEAGYTLKTGSVKYRYGGSDYDPAGSGLIYTFTMPAADVTVRAEFETYSISGTITTDVPIGAASGASVQLKQGGANIGGAVSTDGSGAYIISTVSAGTGYSIEVSLTGYTTGVSSSFDVTGNVTGKDMALVKITVPVYTISGIITTDDLGGAASGASVQLKQSGTNVGNAVNTDGSGAYTIPGVPAGTGYTIEVSLSGYTTGTISPFSVATDVTSKDMALVRIVYTVSGTITTNNPGGTASGASVQLKQGSTNVGNVVNTDGSGAYSISNIPEGTGYTVEVSLNGYITGTISSFNVTTANVTGKDLTLTRIVYSISGTITTDDPGGPVSGASVQLKQGGTAVGGAVSTDGSGAYSISNVPEGTGYTVEVSLSGYTTGTISSFNVTGNETGKDLPLVKIVYTVTFNANGGSSVPPTQTVTEGDTVPEPPAMTKADHLFDSWYKEAALTTPWDFDIDTVTATITLYAKWIPFKMVSVSGGVTFPTGLNDTDGTVTVTDSYEIGETEVTYELWYAVRSWAEGNGYNFYDNPGQEGSSAGTTNTPPGVNKQEPVTWVTWFDVVVWLNALTEWVNEKEGKSLTPVYYYESGCTTVARDSTSITNFVKEDASYDYASAYEKPGATGFRLPSSNEWELAARWRGSDSTNTVSGYTDPYFTKGNSMSGATAGYNNATASGDVAWYSDNASSKTQAVKGKAANTLGLYDMSGNVWEWCFDWDPSNIGSYRIRRGGGWDGNANNLSMSLVNVMGPRYRGSSFGFRPVRTAE